MQSFAPNRRPRLQTYGSVRSVEKITRRSYTQEDFRMTLSASLLPAWSNLPCNWKRFKQLSAERPLPVASLTRWKKQKFSWASGTETWGEIRPELNVPSTCFLPQTGLAQPYLFFYYYPPPSKYVGQGHLMEINLAYVILLTAPDTWAPGGKRHKAENVFATWKRPWRPYFEQLRTFSWGMTVLAAGSLCQRSANSLDIWVISWNLDCFIGVCFVCFFVFWNISLSWHGVFGKHWT